MLRINCVVEIKIEGFGGEAYPALASEVVNTFRVCIMLSQLLASDWPMTVDPTCACVRARTCCGTAGCVTGTCVRVNN